MLVRGRGYSLSLKRYSSWHSSTVTEGYTEESINGNIEISRKLKIISVLNCVLRY